MPHPDDEVDVWSVEGRFQQLVFSPKGAVEGLMIDTDGVPTQFVCDPHDAGVSDSFMALRPGQALVIEGTEAEPSPKGEPEHTVYRLERLVSIDGKPVRARHDADTAVGTVVRFNYAKHGAANGVVLDTGDFVHTKPEGMARLQLKIGDKVEAEGDMRPLATGHGGVMEARRINGVPVGPAHA